MRWPKPKRDVVKDRVHHRIGNALPLSRSNAELRLFRQKRFRSIAIVEIRHYFGRVANDQVAICEHGHFHTRVLARKTLQFVMGKGVYARERELLATEGEADFACERAEGIVVKSDHEATIGAAKGPNKVRIQCYAREPYSICAAIRIRARMTTESSTRESRDATLAR